MTRTELGSYLRRIACTLAGTLFGLLVGLALTLAIVTARARFQQHYLESADEIVGPMGAPVPLGAFAGGAAGWSGAATLTVVSAGGVVGGVVGGFTGWAIASGFSASDADRWAGGTIGAGVGASFGALILLIAVIARSRRSAASLAALCILSACADSPPDPPQIPAAPPLGTDDVESVIFLAGDGGEARYDRYPILPAMAADVENWAERLRRDSAVVVLMLGDNVYPEGMRAPDTDEFQGDSARMADQVAIIRGPASRRFGARMYFVAGNHDWGMGDAREGMRRIRNMGEFLDRVRARGVSVDLLPEAGTGMPAAIEAGRLRIVLLDTAWWLFDAAPDLKQQMLDELRDLLAAGEGPVVIAAHHPYVSAGPHGAFAPAWKQDLGIRYLLSRSGALLQDLGSLPYRDLLLGLNGVFAEGDRPLLFAGGHDHSLQVVRNDTESGPRYSIVSGSASKVSRVGWAPGTLFRRSAPGYMQLIVRRSGAVDLFVKSAPEQFLECPAPDGPEWEHCMAEGTASFTTVFSMRLLENGS
ncbi:MAG TPA: metallophosphoesterase [Longimicrobiales bacterium]|nr:metallophosphoesterase [Longimicrobiales bacterium]